MKTRSETTRLLIALGLGALVFVAGLALARTWLAEWRLGDLPDESFFLQRYRDLAGRLGARLVPETPRVSIAAPDSSTEQVPAILDRQPASSAAVRRAGPRIQIAQDGILPEPEGVRELTIRFSPEGEALNVMWAQHGWSRFSADFNRTSFTEERRLSFARLLLKPGESVGGWRGAFFGGAPVRIYEIRGTPGEHLFSIESPGGVIGVNRRLGSQEQGLAAAGQFRWSAFFRVVVPMLFRFAGVAILFLVLAARRRIDLVNGTVLAGFAFLVSALAGLAGQRSVSELTFALSAAAWMAVWVFLFWSAGESFLRASDPGFTTSLDALRAGRLGPRGGRSLLHGLALGGVLGGLGLTVTAAAVAAPGFWPEAPSLRLPVFGIGHHPFLDGCWIAAMTLLMLGVARRLVAVRWVPWATALAGAVLAPLFQFEPWFFELAANFLLYAVLVFFGQRYGLTALLTAAVSSLLLPAAVFSGLHINWLPVTFAATAGTSALFLVLGLVGLRRPEQIEAERLRPPAFMRRIDEERRLKYEMDLLARMQLGLLPGSLPEIPGWQIAARSILATEAGGDLYDFLVDEEGRLWVAAGDVAGHGYSCAIVQAMTTAALTSLIAPEKTPAEILKQVDRVIRRGGSLRNFASLALLRLDPKTGEVLLSNAGHPFPFFSVNGEVSEIPLPGLPLGQGPQRVYRDLVFHLPPGSALVFCSDGLNETRDWSEVPYGFDRPREVLQSVHDATAPEMLDALLADWRKYLGQEEPPDDTTVVILKRAG